MTLLAVLIACVAAQLALSVAAAGLAGRPAATPLVYGGAFAVSIVGLGTALWHLLGWPFAPETLALPLGLPWIGAHLRLDALAAFFLAVIHLGGAAASLYAIGYGRHEVAPARVLPFFPAFLGAMTLVVMADDAFVFLTGWEFMSITSWALVMSHHVHRANARAGYIYLVMASFGTLMLLLSFGALAGPDGDFTFAAIRAHPASPGVTALAMALALVGAGSKAGIVPLHVWLPLAHPAAPSHVSALMSGVMTKVAVYAFIRIGFDLLGEHGLWAGVVILALGGITAVMGVLYALMEHDLKRLLAYHTVENIGIIFIGLGLAVAFHTGGLAAPAALALTAALFHVLNHSLFKSLLFFGSGAVLSATGERDMDQLGGLIHRMPRTALLFLVGAAAISALPPLNGFVSEWLTFQAILLSPELRQWGLRIEIPAVGTLLALSAALAAACFVKAFGITFLGRPRSRAAERAREADPFSIAAMTALAGLCVLAGILPGLIIDALGPVVAALIGEAMPQQSAVPWLSIVPIAASRSSYNGLLVLLFIVTSSGLAVASIHRLASHALRRAPPWDCGFPDPDPATQYTPSSFAQPIRRVFAATLLGARERVEMPPPGDLAPARFSAELRDPAWDWIFTPLVGFVSAAAERLNRLQFLTIRQYLTLVFLALVALLCVLAVAQ